MIGRAVIVWFVLCVPLRGADEIPTAPAGNPKVREFEQRVQPLLNKYCSKCHGMQEPKGDFSIHVLSADLAPGKNRVGWASALKKLKAGEMPPKEQAQFTAEESQELVAWIELQLQAAVLSDRKAQGRTVLRRLNRDQYENTVCDLLQIKTDLKELLALDGAADGFDNVGSALHLSSFALERYLEAGNRALNLAIANTPRPPLIQKRYDLKNQHFFRSTDENVYRQLDDALVLFTSSPWRAAWLSEFYPPDGGQYRIRVSATAIQSGDQPVTYRVTSGDLRGKNGLIGYFDVNREPKIMEAVVRLEPRAGLSILPYGLPRSTEILKIGVEKYSGPGVAIQWVEVEGPLHESWPPPSHKELLGELPRKQFPSDQVNLYHEVVSEEPEQDARNILERFLPRAFRREATKTEIDAYLQLFRDKIQQEYRFERAIRVPLLAALVSQDFLFLQETPGPLDDFALASRLSYFLWSSMPDNALFQLAKSKQLTAPEVLRQQVERMLNDPKAAAFTENFVGQWLGLRNIDFTEPNYLIYPEFDHLLKVSMIRETELFFDELLKHDLSLANLIDSDFSMLNGRLARHYGIPGAEGWEFKKVPLPKGCHRGGVLTMASVLKVTANGSYTHPVHRGVWVLERILGKRPPNPPANVPVVEPDIRGAKGIRDLLARHRQGACAGCHAQIDPPGFALESFDVIGGWRDNYRTVGLGEPVEVEGQRMGYLRGPKIDCVDVLPDGRKFQNIDEYKQLLLTEQDQIARTLAAKLVTYATGASPEAVDQRQLDELVENIRNKNFGLRSLVHAVVQSPLFRDK